MVPGGSASAYAVYSLAAKKLAEGVDAIYGLGVDRQAVEREVRQHVEGNSAAKCSRDEALVPDVQTYL